MKFYTDYIIKTDKLWELETLSYLKMTYMVFRDFILLENDIYGI